MSREGWKPAILESEKYFLQLAEVEGKLDIQSLRQPLDAFYRRAPVTGDIFFRGADVYYIITGINDFIIDEMGRRIRMRGPEDEPALEVGIVSSQPEGLDERIRQFSECVEKVLRASLDGRKVRHINFEWREQTPGTPHLQRIITKDQEESGARFAHPSLDQDSVAKSSVLSIKLSRELLIELSQAGFAREQDILARRKMQEQIKDALETLKSAGLINSEFLLECKRSKTPLTRLSDRAKLDEPEVAALVCPTCGAKFGDEILTGGYSVSEVGKTLVKQSHWMTIWITDLLVKLGISQDAILWNISENGEEVDLLVEFLGQLWIFELKDREFGAGDAHPLNYRQVRYQATKAIVFTTEKVSRDAKRVFEELEREAARQRTGRTSRTPIYIEGLENAEETLRREIAKVSLGYANRKLVMLGQVSGYNLGMVLSKRFGEVIDVQNEDDGLF